MSQSSTNQNDAMRDRALLFECGEWIIALPATNIERVGFASDLSIRPFDVLVSDESPALVGMTEEAGFEKPTWDMGVILGQAAQFESYARVSIPTSGASYEATLLCGRVLTFESIPRSMLSGLPPTLFKRRVGSIGAGFPVNSVLPNQETNDGRPGLWIDLRRLWSKSELIRHEQFLAIGSE